MNHRPSISDIKELVRITIIYDSREIVLDEIQVRFAVSFFVNFFETHSWVLYLEYENYFRIERGSVINGGLSCQLSPQSGYCLMEYNKLLFPLRTDMTLKAFVNRDENFVLEKTSIEDFTRHLYVDPNNNIETFSRKILGYHTNFVNNVSEYKASYISFVQSSGMGKTSTALKLGTYFKLLYISCRNPQINVQPMRSEHVLRPLMAALNANRLKSQMVYRMFFLCCLEAAHSVEEATFVWATPEHFRLIMNIFVDKISTIETSNESTILLEINRYYVQGTNPLLIVFDEAKSLLEASNYSPSIFHGILQALKGVKSIFCMFLDTEPKIAISTVQELKLFPVYITTPYMDVLTDEEDKRVDIRALCIADLIDAKKNAEFDRDLSVLLFQSRPLWMSMYNSRRFIHGYNSAIKFAVSKLTCKPETISLLQLIEQKEDSAILSLANYKYNLIVAPGHILAHEIVTRNMAVCVGVSDNRNEIFSICASEPIIIEAINKFLLFSDQNLLVDRRVVNAAFYFKNISAVLKKILEFKEQGALSRGDSGEFIARVIFGLAADMTQIAYECPSSSIPLLVQSYLYQALGFNFVESLELPQEFLCGFVSCSHFIRMFATGSSLTSELARLAFMRNAALITWRNFPGSDLEIPVAYCKDTERINMWRDLLDFRATRYSELDPQQKIDLDTRIDDLTVFTFISISVKNQVEFTKSLQISAFKSLNPFRRLETGNESLRSRHFKVKNSFNLQILFSLKGTTNSISEFTAYNPEGIPESYSSRRVLIDGFSPQTFNHWNNAGFNFEDATRCFDQLNAYDYDTESKKFMNSIETNAEMMPFSLYGDGS